MSDLPRRLAPIKAGERITLNNGFNDTRETVNRLTAIVAPGQKKKTPPTNDTVPPQNNGTSGDGGGDSTQDAASSITGGTITGTWSSFTTAQYTANLVDTDTGEETGDTLTDTYITQVSWLADASSVGLGTLIITLDMPGPLDTP